MSKFVVVKKAPVNLSKVEHVLKGPDFLPEIQANAHKASKKKQTSLNHMRDILVAIDRKYQSDLNVFKVPLSQYEGLAFETEDDLNTIVTNLLKREHPAVFDKILEYNIKNRPYGTKLLYYVGDLGDTGPFFRHGVDMIEEKEIEDYLGNKPKKVVGKPALTKEEAEEKASQ